MPDNVVMRKGPGTAASAEGEPPRKQAFYTLKEVGELLRFDEETIRRKFRGLPGVLMVQGGKGRAQMRISDATLSKWIADHSAGFTVKVRNRRV
jgi:hypothetical protein